jgi:transcription elongation GreA/GreB family factor
MILTRAGAEKLKDEIFKLEKQYKELMLTKGEVMDLGGDDWHDNSSYDELQNEERMLIAEIEKRKIIFQNAQIIEPVLSNKTISIGSSFIIKYPDGSLRKLIITDPILANPDKNMISYESPMGGSFMGAAEGETRTFKFKDKPLAVTIVKINGQ